MSDKKTQEDFIPRLNTSLLASDKSSALTHLRNSQSDVLFLRVLSEVNKLIVLIVRLNTSLLASDKSSALTHLRNSQSDVLFLYFFAEFINLSYLYKKVTIWRLRQSPSGRKVPSEYPARIPFSDAQSVAL